MTRVLSLWFPAWPTDRRRRRDSSSRDTRGVSTAWLLVEDRRGQRVVAACCAYAAHHGVRVGVTLAHARALVGDALLRVEPYEPERDAAALRALARWALRFSPRVATDPPGGLLLDVAGCERLYQGLPNLLRVVLDAVRRLGLDAKAAIAPTAGSAWAVSHYGEGGHCTVTEEDLDRVIPTLPIAALRLDPGTLERLTEVAVDRVEHVLAIPREQLAGRYGPALLHRLDAAMGHADDAWEPVRLVDPPRAEREFLSPVTQWEAVQLGTRGLVDALVAALDARKLGALQLTLAVDRYEAGPLRVVFELSSAERDAGHLWSVMRPSVEQLHLGRGIERLTLVATRTASLPGRQLGWNPEHEPAAFDAAALGRVVDLLKGRLGEEGVMRAKLVDTHVPEAACVWEPVTAGSLQRTAPAALPLDKPRPPILLHRPEPAEVMLLRPDGPVLSLRWRDESRRIVTAIGPEAIGGRWWLGPCTQERTPARSYYRVQDETGRWLWVFRESRSRKWFVHGTWG